MSGHSAGHDDHKLPLWALFLALLALTAVEVVLYDLWVEYDFVPKYVLVLLILVFTIPKAGIVLVYFMHLKFEKELIVVLAIVPFFLAAGAVLTPLTDALTLKDRAFNKVDQIGSYEAPGHGDTEASHEEHEAEGDHDDSGGY